MCLLAILYRVIDQTPIVLIANREEVYARGGANLDLRQGPTPYIAGLDPVAGGTWLGVNAHRLIVAVTNREKSQLPPQPRSRGLLVRDLLALGSAREAARVAAHELESNRYAGCNIVCADLESLWVVHAGDWLRMRSLAPGCHVLTNADINDGSDERICWTLEQIHKAPPQTVEQAFEVFAKIASHTGPPASICLRGEEGGTVASTLLALDERPRHSRLLHAPGPPDRVAYADRTDLLWELEGPAS